MIKVDNKVKNIYIMLCYSFYGDRLNEKEEEDLGAEAFENIYNLFSLLLCSMLKKIVKKGIYKDYIDKEDEITVIKGRININKTLSKTSLSNKKIYCNYDEYNENCLMNQVIKTTIYYLIKSNKIGNYSKNKLKKYLNYYNNVDYIEVNSIKWDRIKFNRNNILYKYIIDICKMILNELIVVDNKGKYKYKEYLDDREISSIYENFIKAFYRRHYPIFNAKSRKLFFTSNNTKDFIPSMRTDIVLEYEDRMLIIDTKFYSKILLSGYINSQCKIISNEHINQILTYVDNQDPYKKGNVYGMLLYAQTIDEPAISFIGELNHHKIIIKTLDLNENWDNISKRLKNIAVDFINNTF